MKLQLSRKLPKVNSKLILQAVAVVGLVAFGGLLVDISSNSSQAATKWRPMFTGDTVTPTELKVAVVTPDGDDYYDVRNFAGNVYITAPDTNTGGNLRQFMWPNGKKRQLNTTVCATWVGESTSRAQQGLAVRITSTGGVTRGVTVTKNVIYGIHWAFNVHVWDSSNWGGTSETAFSSIAQFDMRDVILNDIGRMEYMPWRTCLRAVNDQLRFKIWFPNKMVEPAWNDARYTRTVTIPPEYVVPGQSGWYAGHIPASGDIEYINLGSWKRLD